jgi:hypothetical protein
VEVIKQDAVGGIITFWTLSDFTSREALVQGFGRADLAQFVPEAQEPVTVLKDALTSVLGGRSTLIRPLAKRSGWAVVGEAKGQEKNDYHHLARAEVTNSGDILIVPNSPDWTTEQTDAVYREFSRYAGMVPSERLASSLVDIAFSLGGIRLRPRAGGIYFIPPGKVERWREAALAVEAAGKNAMYQLNQELNPDTVRVIRDAIAAEAEAVSARLHQEILSGELGERAMRTRQAELAALQQKLSEYETILGVGLEDLRAKADAAGNLHLTAELMSYEGNVI